MDKALATLISNLKSVSDISNMDDSNPITHRISNPTVRKVTTIVCSTTEPVNLVLPLNVVWFVFDKASTYYGQALQRVSKTASTSYTYTWQAITTMDELYEDQYYDSEDTTALGAAVIPAATTSVLGIARLSVAATTASSPVVVGEGDARLSDARVPLPHTHEEVPATQIKTKTGVVTISNSAAPDIGATLVATSSTTAVWRKLTFNDISE